MSFTPGMEIHLEAWARAIQLLLFTRSVLSDSFYLSYLHPHGCSTPDFPILHHLTEFPQTHVHWVGDAIQPPNPLLSSSPPAFNLSQHRGLFQWVGSSYQVAKALELQLQHQSFQWMLDWLDLLAVQGTLKSLLQHHSSKASILQRSAFFMVQLSYPYMTTGKTIALTTWTFVGKVMSLLFNTLSRLVIAFLPSSKCLLVSWLQLPSAVILEPKKIKTIAASTFSPFYLPFSISGLFKILS